MAGTLIANTINTDTAGAVFTTQNAVTGIAKAWVNFQPGATPTIRGSFNVSSVTYSAVGFYNINFTTAMPNTNYVTQVSNTQISAGWAGAGIGGYTSFNSYSTTQVQIVNVAYPNGYYDPFYCGVTVFSS